MTQFNHVDFRSKPDGTYVEFERFETFDPDTSPADFDGISKQRRIKWERDVWHYIGIQARAHICIVRNNTGTLYILTSPGLWGTESDSDESYKESIFKEECETLKRDILAMGAASF